MNQISPFSYEFGSFRFDPSKGLLYCGDKYERLSKTLLKLLLALVESEGCLIENDELIETVWEGRAVTTGNLTVRITELRKTLKKYDPDTEYIVNHPAHGYRFGVEVKKVPQTNGTTLIQPEQQDISDEQNNQQEIRGELSPTDAEISSRKITSVGSYHPDKIHLLTGSLLYGLMFAVALVLEIAFRFDEHRQMALPLAASLFLWIAATSQICLRFDWKFTLEGKKTGLGFPVSVFFIAAVLAFIVAAFFLPNQPLTLSTTTSQTAQGAFFKNVFIYFLPPAIFFWVMPFHCVAALRHDINEGKWRETRKLLLNEPGGISPKGAIYFKPRTLGLIFLLIAAVSLFLTYNLLEKLKPNAPYLNLFTLLVFVRLGLCFVLVVWCLYWYEQQLNQIKDECKTFITNEPNLISKNENGISDKNEQFIVWKSVAALNLAGNIILAAFLIYPLIQNRTTTPHIDSIKLLTRPVRAKEFYISLDGNNFDTQQVRLKVIGQGCPNQRPCEIPNDALWLYGKVTKSKIENAPITVGIGEYQIAAQNGDNGNVSNTVAIYVNPQ
jgi:DNA-binding winged helix-turn-helix (wHTH) protein